LANVHFSILYCEGRPAGPVPCIAKNIGALIRQKRGAEVVGFLGRVVPVPS